MEIVNSSAAIMFRPLYDVFADKPSLLEHLQQHMGLPSLSDMHDDNVRIPTSNIIKIFNFISKEEQCPQIGLELGLQQKPIGALGALGYLLFSCNNLFDALHEFTQYYHFTTVGVAPPKWELLSSGDLRVEFHSLYQGDQQTKILVDLLTGNICGALRILLGEDFRPLKIELPLPTPGNNDNYYARILDCEVTFANKGIRFYIGADWIEKPFLTANKKRKDIFRKELDNIVSGLDRDSTIVSQIRTLFGNLTTLKGVSQSWAAKQLHMSDRTLARRLDKLGLTFRDLLTNYRSAEASHLLIEGHTIEEVSHYLGFSERAAFDRAFKKWFGITPASFQAHYQPLLQMDNFHQLIDLYAIPALPSVAPEALAELQQGQDNGDKLAELMVRDPALITKLVSLTNHSLYGFFALSKLDQVIEHLLSNSRVKQATCTMLSVPAQPLPNHFYAFFKRYWVVSMAMAEYFSELIAHSSNAELCQREAYLIGLTANLGELILCHHYPIQQIEVLKQIGFFSSDGANTSSGVSGYSQLQKRVMGIHGLEIGSLLVAKWQLPKHCGILLRNLANEDFNGLIGAESLLFMDLLNGLYTIFGAPQQRQHLSLPHQNTFTEQLGLPNSALERVNQRLCDDMRQWIHIADDIVGRDMQGQEKQPLWRSQSQVNHI